MKSWGQIKEEAVERLSLKLELKTKFGVPREMTRNLSIDELKELIVKKQKQQTTLFDQ